MSDTVSVLTTAAAQAADTGLQSQIDALSQRVSTLESGTKPPDPPTNTVSPEGTKMPPAASLNSITTTTDPTIIVWTLANGVLSRNGTPDTSTSGVVLGEIVNLGQMRQTNAAGDQWDYTPDAAYHWTAVSKPPVPGSVFTVSLSGFKDTSGNTWRMRGLNGGVRDALDGIGNVFRQFPAMSCYRLNSGAADAAADIDRVVQQFNSHNCVVIIEDHSGVRRDTNWYTMIAGKYKTNPMVMIGVPNEPSGDVANDQIAVINAIKAAGFPGLIGLQCGGGWQYDYINTVTNACGKDQLFLTPHIYYNGTDPNGGENYMNSDIKGATDRGLWCSFTEFGDAMDGWHRNQYGLKLVDSVIAAEKAGRCGALFWAMDNDNHPDGTCSAFLTRDGSQLTPVGINPLQPWLR